MLRHLSSQLLRHQQQQARRLSCLQSVSVGAQFENGISNQVVRWYRPSIVVASGPPFASTTPVCAAAAAGGYSMSALKQLRSTSAAPIVECKKALEAAAKEMQQETTADDEALLLQKAVDWLRQHGAAKASSKVADRTSTEGLVGFVSTPTSSSSSMEPQAAILIKVASETDFAGRSDTFVQLVENIAQATLDAASSNSSSSSTDAASVLSKEEIYSTQSTATGKTVQELMDDAIVAIRENISVTNVQQLRANNDKSMWVGYVHNRIHPTCLAGTAAAAVLVEAATDEDVSRETLEEIGKKLAMHVVAARPRYLEPSEIPSDVVDKERGILHDQIAADASNQKPPEIVQKIVDGRMRKFYEEVCMMEQGHMVEEKNPKVKAFLKERGVQLKQFRSLFIA